METLEVTILPEDFAKAPHGYHSHGSWDGPFTGCVLYWALRRTFPEMMENEIYVGASIAGVKDKSYHIYRSKWGGDEITGEFSEFSLQKINRLSEQAKESLEGIPTVSLSLEPF